MPNFPAPSIEVGLFGVQVPFYWALAEMKAQHTHLLDGYSDGKFNITAINFLHYFNKLSNLGYLITY